MILGGRINVNARRPTSRNVANNSNTFEIEGMEDLAQKILELPDRTKRLEVLKILRRQMREIRDVVRNATPVSDRTSSRMAWVNYEKKRVFYKPGNLRKSIGIYTGKSKFKPNVYVGPAMTKRGGKLKKNDGYYAAFLVYGTGTSAKSKKHYDYIRRAAAPYLGSVSKTSANEIKKYIDKRIKTL